MFKRRTEKLQTMTREKDTMACRDNDRGKEADGDGDQRRRTSRQE